MKIEQAQTNYLAAKAAKAAGDKAVLMSRDALIVAEQWAHVGAPNAAKELLMDASNKYFRAQDQLNTDILAAQAAQAALSQASLDYQQAIIEDQQSPAVEQV